MCPFDYYCMVLIIMGRSKGARLISKPFKIIDLQSSIHTTTFLESKNLGPFPCSKSLDLSQTNIYDFDSFPLLPLADFM